MIIPIKTDYKMTRRPLVNYAIIAANAALFLLGFHGGDHARTIAQSWLLQPDNPQLYQFFTSMFMHGGWTHILGNMLFLWVFGNAINDRFGHAGYLAFYLAGGILAGVGYIVLSGTAPVLGASGAISAVTGAYLVLLPRARVTLLAFLVYVVMPLEVSSLYFLLFQFGWNLLMSYGPLASTGGGGVAYAAHSSGYVFGIVVAVVMLAGKLLPPDQFDIVNLVRSARRRSQYRRMVAGGYDPFNYGRPGKEVHPEHKRWVDARNAETAVPDSPSAKEIQLRREISALVLAHDVAGAAAKYLQLRQVNPDAVLSRQQQLDVANYMMSAEQHDDAAAAYETFLRHYNNYEYVADIYLMLGLLYGRYIQQDDPARKYLELAIGSLTDQRKLDLAKADLEALRKRNESD